MSPAKKNEIVEDLSRRWEDQRHAARENFCMLHEGMPTVDRGDAWSSTSDRTTIGAACTRAKFDHAHSLVRRVQGLCLRLVLVSLGRLRRSLSSCWL